MESTQDLYNREAILLVKILREEVSFKASFEGRKGRAVTESERKRIPDSCSREPELRHDCHSVFCSRWRCETLSSEQERGDLEGT